MVRAIAACYRTRLSRPGGPKRVVEGVYCAVVVYRSCTHPATVCMEEAQRQTVDRTRHASESCRTDSRAIRREEMREATDGNEDAQQVSSTVVWYGLPRTA